MRVQDLDIYWDKGYLAGDAEYRTVKCPNHPNAWKNGYVYLHRLIKELEIGRFLKDGEIVHHKDEDKSNNHPSNLEIKSQSNHAREHTTGIAITYLKCSWCEKPFTRETRQVKKGKNPFCSHSCRGKFYSKPT